MKRPDLDIVAINYPYKQEFWEEIKKKFNIDFRVGDGLNLEFKDKSFDAILTFGVLEHVNEYKGRSTKDGENLFLNEVHRVTKENGVFFICNLPNYYSLNEFFSLILTKNHHDRRFRKKELKKLLQKYGFKINKIEREYFLPTQWDYLGEGMSKFTNKFYRPLIFLDRLLMSTPLRFFSEGFLCVSRKK